MRKVLMVCNDLPYFRAHRENVAQALVERGDKVVVAAGNSEKTDIRDWPPQMTLVPLSLSPHRFEPMGDWRLIRSLHRLLETERPDLVHAITIKPILYTSLALLTSRAKPAVVWTFPGLGKVFEPSPSILARGREWLVGAVLRSAAKRLKAHATFENAGDLEAMTEAGIVDRRRAHLLAGTGLPLQYKAPKRPPRQPDEKVRVLMATRLLREKGVDTYLRAASELGNEKFEFVLAGPIDPSNPDSVDAEVIEAAQSAGTVRYLGMLHVPAMRDQLARADVFCLPSRLREGFPRSLMEAAAAGCCLVATDQPGMRTLVIEGETGRLIHPARPEDLTRVLGELADSPSALTRLGNAAQRRVDDLGLWETNVIAQMFTAYADAQMEARP